MQYSGYDPRTQKGTLGKTYENLNQIWAQVNNNLAIPGH